MKKMLVIFVVLTIFFGCVSRDSNRPGSHVSNRRPDQIITMITTAYCPCGKCCAWKRNFFGQPISQNGKRKKVGITASGTKAQKGTLAADFRKFPKGTIMYIPGYGYGRVEDTGSSIKGTHIDLFFPTHQKALAWGKKSRLVQIWFTY